MPNYPVIAGVGQFTNHPRTLADAVEPADMMARVAREAAADAGAPDLCAKLDSIQVVGMIGWTYEDAPGEVAARIGAQPAHTLYSAVGGETPQRLVNETAQAIVEGRIRAALITGAEALESRRLARKLEEKLPWRRGTPRSITGDQRPGFSSSEASHGAIMPTRVYPLFENALRAHAGRAIPAHQAYLGRLCERLAAVAATNPYAWFREPRTAEEIISVTPGNRWVGFPYPKLMNAIIEVDQAAAVIVTGSETARELGIPAERLVYLHGCGEAVDKWFVSERVNYWSSPAIRAATRRALGMAGISVDDVAAFDLYSCFPSAVEYALEALEIAADDPRPLTVTGGLPYAGGPGNNYVTHSIAAMAQHLRAQLGDFGLVTGLGWFATKHSAGVYSTRPPSGAWVRTDPAVDQAVIDSEPSPPFIEQADGPAIIETYTVCFNRDGNPELGIVIGRLDHGAGPAERFIANTPENAELLWAMTRDECVGKRGRVQHDPGTGKNLFSPL